MCITKLERALGFTRESLTSWYCRHMLIISDFHDYYDNAAVYGVDKTIVYRRSTELIELAGKECASDPWVLRPHDLDLRNGERYGVYESVLGYCGQLFPRLRLCAYQQDTKSWVDLFQTYELDEYAAWVNSLPAPYRGRWYTPIVREKSYREAFFSPASHSALKELFVLHSVPLFLYERRFYRWREHNDYLRGKLTLNPSLRELEFQQLKDAPSAFQDIYMFISGVLGMPAKPLVEISDEVKQAKHGFTGEYSFRKPPGKKTRWR